MNGHFSVVSTISLCLFFLLTGCTRPGQVDVVWPAGLNQRDPIGQCPKIVIDAGHGGKDLGTSATTIPICHEKALNLTTALLLNNYLQKMGYQTILTRGEDFFVPLKLRAAIANSNRASIFVSVHFNSAPNTQAKGVEIYYFDSEKNKERASQSYTLANKVLKRITSSTKCKNRGVKHGNFAVIRETTMPAILIEGGFMTNQSELEQLRSSGYLKTLAGSIALGIHDFVKQR